MPQRSISEVQSAHTEELMAIAGVVGTAIGEDAGQPCILVLVSKRTESLTRKIPHDLEGYPVRIREVGHVRALEEE